MIGGTDVVLPVVGDPDSLEACARIVHRHWPEARFEDAITGDKYDRPGEIPYGRVRELLVYPDAEAEAAWDGDHPDSPENSMLSLIARPEDLTIVLDNPETPKMESILSEIREILSCGSQQKNTI